MYMILTYIENAAEKNNNLRRYLDKSNNKLLNLFKFFKIFVIIINFISCAMEKFQGV